MTQALETLKELLEGETDEAKEWYALKEKAQKYTQEQTDFDKRFIRFRTDNIHTLYKLPRNGIDILLFLRGGVNRDPGYKIKNGVKTYHKVWADLDAYYNNDLLVTARSQNFISKKLGVDQAQICRSMQRLIKLGYVRPLGSVKIFYSSKGKYSDLTVFCLGVLINGVEVYYHELGEEIEVEVEQEDF